MYFSGLTFYQKQLPTCFGSVDSFYGMTGSSLTFEQVDAVIPIIDGVVTETPPNLAVSIDLVDSSCVSKIDIRPSGPLVISDTFTGVNGTGISLHSSEVGSGYIKQYINAPDTMVIVDGKLQTDVAQNGGGPSVFSNLSKNPLTNFYVEFDVYYSPSSNSEIIFGSLYYDYYPSRIDLGSTRIINFYENTLNIYADTTTNTFQFYSRDNAVYNLSDFGIVLQTTLPYKVRIEITEKFFTRVYCNGILIFTEYRTSTIVPDYFETNHTMLGVREYDTFENAPKFDNYKVGLIGTVFMTADSFISRFDMSSDLVNNLVFGARISIEDPTPFPLEIVDNVVATNIPWGNIGYACELYLGDDATTFNLNLTGVEVGYRYIQIHNDPAKTYPTFTYSVNGGTTAAITYGLTGVSLYGSHVSNIRFYWNGTTMTYEAVHLTP